MGGGGSATTSNVSGGSGTGAGASTRPRARPLLRGDLAPVALSPAGQRALDQVKHDHDAAQKRRGSGAAGAGYSRPSVAGGTGGDGGSGSGSGSGPDARHDPPTSGRHLRGRKVSLGTAGWRGKGSHAAEAELRRKRELTARQSFRLALGTSLPSPATKSGGGGGGGGGGGFSGGDAMPATSGASGGNEIGVLRPTGSLTKLPQTRGGSTGQRRGPRSTRAGAPRGRHHAIPENAQAAAAGSDDDKEEYERLGHHGPALVDAHSIRKAKSFAAALRASFRLDSPVRGVHALVVAW